MDLIAIVLYLVCYYLRPQEWGPLFAKIQFVQLIMVFAVLAVVFRERSVRLRDLIRTPHDWAMLLFWAWLVVSSPTPWETFQNTYSLPITYFIIVQVLTSIPRIKKFVGWW